MTDFDDCPHDELAPADEDGSTYCVDCLALRWAR